MQKKPQHDQHQQLELDLWQIFAVAQAEPEAANMVMLCGHLEGLDLIDGARAIGEIGEIFQSKAEIVLATYLPQEEPVIDDDLWAHLYLRTFVLNDGHLYLETEHYYPEERQSVIKLGAEADLLVADELQEIEAIKQILGNAHSEDIPSWAERIRGVMAKVGAISLLELQKRSRLSLVDLWLGLLLGNTGSSMERSGGGDDEGFYRRDGILVLGSDRFVGAKDDSFAHAIGERCDRSRV
jgi:hypothetical protein